MTVTGSPESGQRKSSRPSNVPVAFACLGLAFGAALRLAGANVAGETVWIVTIASGIAYSLYSTVRSLAMRRLGVDLIALLALVGTLLVREYLAGAIISVMLTSGGALENWAAGQARRDLQALLERAPRTAHRYVGDALETIGLNDVVAGDLLMVASGELVPVDGSTQRLRYSTSRH
jgi:cation transport ATPase